MNDVADILAYLGCASETPGIRPLNRLIDSYVHRVPWESVFRIAKHASTTDLSERPRWPDEFWQDAIQSGGGGTCFESNYAFFWLLQQLGYTGYLTVNDMGDQRGCHAAILLHLHGRKYLVDVGIPLLVALPVSGAQITRRTTWLHTYAVHPDGLDTYQVLRSRHPKPNIYTLLDTPVCEPDYRRVVEQDYGLTGLFLDQVILVKIIGDRLWRFSTKDQPYRMEWFSQATRGEVMIPPGQTAYLLAERFQMDQGKIEAALDCHQQTALAGT
jgi:arylamine N-acetyltransferase